MPSIQRMTSLDVPPAPEQARSPAGNETHILPHQSIQHRRADVQCLCEREESFFQGQIVSGNDGARIEEVCEHAGPEHVDVDDGDVVTAEPVTRDP